MDKEAKNKISHRYKALQKVKEWMQTNPTIWNDPR